MPRRRLRVYYESESQALIDEKKLERNYGDIEGGPVKLQNHLKRSVVEGDATIRGVLECLGADGEIEPYLYADVDFVIEEECPHHPGEFVRSVPAEKCLRCSDERLGQKP